jgi:hypothetical protein
MTSVAQEPIASAYLRPILSLKRPPAMAPMIAQTFAPMSKAKPVCLGMPTGPVT